jgi:hypothetical protein
MLIALRLPYDLPRQMKSVGHECTCRKKLSPVLYFSDFPDLGMSELNHECEPRTPMVILGARPEMVLTVPTTLPGPT